MSVILLENKDMLEFLIETDKSVHKELVHALDFASMKRANNRCDLGRTVYYKTKKDVVEYKRKKPYEALIDKDVMKFAFIYSDDLWEWYNGNRKYLKRYLELCQKEVR